MNDEGICGSRSSSWWTMVSKKSKQYVAAIVCDGGLGVEECPGCEAGRRTGPCSECHGQMVVPTHGRRRDSGLFVFGTQLERWPLGGPVASQGMVDRYIGSDAHFAYDVRPDSEGCWMAMASTWDFDGETGMSCTVMSDSAGEAAHLLEAELRRVAGCVGALEEAR